MSHSVPKPTEVHPITPQQREEFWKDLKALSEKYKMQTSVGDVNGVIIAFYALREHEDHNDGSYIVWTHSEQPVEQNILKGLADVCVDCIDRTIAEGLAQISRQRYIH